MLCNPMRLQVQVHTETERGSHNAMLSMKEAELIKLDAANAKLREAATHQASEGARF